MKKIIVLTLIALAGFWLYKNHGSMMSGPGAFDEQGKPRVILFIADACGAPCTDVATELRARNIPFEEVNGMTEEGRSRFDKFGETMVPLTVIGHKKVVTNDLPTIESALAEVSGIEVLPPVVQQVMRNHFDANGKPRVVMYGTNWCPSCKKMKGYMDDHKIPYLFVDVEGSRGAREDFETLRGRGYPLIFVGFRRIDGYNGNLLSQAVKDLL